MQGTTEFHYQIADTLLPQTDAVFEMRQRLTLLWTCSIRRIALPWWLEPIGWRRKDRYGQVYRLR